MHCGTADELEVGGQRGAPPHAIGDAARQCKRTAPSGSRATRAQPFTKRPSGSCPPHIFGQINVDTSFTNATNVVNLGATGPMKDALEQLLKQTLQLVDKLPEDQREDAAKNAETIAREATSKKPTPGILLISGKGLVEAATAVAEMAKPIATAVGAVLGVLGLAL